ncbi:MAG: cob(I)yrinic acid a,c-diamide adenosyltransferase [Acidobacteria bacterium]|nr:MAG: cob(I)yrinic acid a,c-diamide adenosyltransferase [Acidobacteriota bacterium]RLE20334.1 MAG: cob(I)yrinic acid a,c-diamide adenosyltransferase [Acidobacteriota bacterium]
MKTISEGLVHVYTGNGKGKTTAALGLAIRAAGRGFPVFIGQFMKGVVYGELAIEKFTGGLVQIRQFGTDSLVHTANENDRRLAKAGLNTCREAIQSGKYAICMLDEVNIAIHMGLLNVKSVVEVVQNRPRGVEVVLTGRYAPQEILNLADYISEMIEIRHPYQKGIPAREGIER